jgi:hypothetical protein
VGKTYRMLVVRETRPIRWSITVDLAVKDLQERLQNGKIYAQDKIPWALEHFFKEQNLEQLRELALQEEPFTTGVISSFSQAPVAEAIVRTPDRDRPTPPRRCWSPFHGHPHRPCRDSADR